MSTCKLHEYEYCSRSFEVLDPLSISRFSPHSCLVYFESTSGYVLFRGCSFWIDRQFHFGGNSIADFQM